MLLFYHIYFSRQHPFTQENGSWNCRSIWMFIQKISWMLWHCIIQITSKWFKKTTAIEQILLRVFWCLGKVGVVVGMLNCTVVHTCTNFAMYFATKIRVSHRIMTIVVFVVGAWPQCVFVHTFPWSVRWPEVLLTPTAMGRSASRSRDGAASGGGGSGKDGNSKRISEKFCIMASQPTSP